MRPSRLLLSALTAGLCLQLATFAFGAAGRTEGSFAITPAGTASYTIPIWAPPGPRGVQPQMALVYDSGGGGGSVGVGWSLAGLSSISRCNRTYAQDSSPAAVTLTYADAFCLDGKRLRLTSSTNLSTYGQAGTTYQTEIADFSTVTANGVAGNGPATFVVKARNGLTFEYGNGANSQVLATGTSTASTWMLNKVSDRANNRMVITYNAPDSSLTGMTLPASISWTPTSDESSSFLYTMEFEYVSNTPQSSIIGYVAGTSVLNADLLASISVKHSGTVVRKYVLTYETSPTTGAYRLQQVKECSDASATDCLSPTTMVYQNGMAGTTTTPTSPIGAGTFTALIARYDFNGDGYTDIAYKTGATWFVSFGSSFGFTAGHNTGLGGTVGFDIVFGDLRGTGSDEILAKNGSAWWTYKWNGSSFSGSTTGLTFVSNTATTLADINGDGLPDLITLLSTFSDPNYQHQMFTRLNTSSAGAASFSSTQVTAWSKTAPTFGVAVGPAKLITVDQQHGPLRSVDMNGDGREDVVLTTNECAAWIPNPGGGVSCAPGGVVWITYSMTSQNNGTFNPVAILGPYNVEGLVSFINWNNDSCTDLLSSFALGISACNGGAATTMSVSSNTRATMDWDGDGRTDLVLGNTSTSSLQIQLSTGSGASSSFTTSVPWSADCTLKVFDANGDGLDEIGCWRTATSPGFALYVHNGTGGKPDLMSSATDGYGLRVSTIYVTLTRGTYEKIASDDTPATYPYRNYIGPDYVATGYSITDTGHSGHSYSVQVQYAGAWMHLQGRGFSGFGRTFTFDDRNEFDDYQYFRRDFPYTGRPVERKILHMNATPPVRQEIHTWSAHTLESAANNQRYFPFMSQSTGSEWEFGGPRNGQLITTSSISRTYDNSGNATNIATTITDKDSLSPYFNQQWVSTAARTILPDAGANWCLGLPTVETITNTAPGVPIITRTMNFTPDYANCRITQKITEPSSGTYAVTESYGFDGFGNINSVTVTGAGMSARTSTINWGTTGQFPATVTNPLSQQTEYDYDFEVGLRSSVTDPNDITTSWAYDNFGRKTREDRPDDTATTWSYADCATAGCVNTANRITVTEARLKADQSVLTDRFVYLDRFDRTLVTRQRLLGGDYDRNEVQYDKAGRLWRQAAPCSWSACGTVHWTTNTYDLLGRLTQIQRPISASNSSLQTSTIQYAGRATTTTDPQGKQSIKINMVSGSLGRSQDHDGHYQSFVYDAFGSLLSVTDNLSNALFSATYDYGIDAFQRTVTDADLGARSNTYNALGELTQYSDAKSQNFSVTYDALSRPLVRTEPGLTTTFTYGTSAGNHNIGQLQSVSAGSYSESYTYDDAARTTSRSITIPSDGTYLYELGYHAQTGLLDSLTYPVSTSSYRLKLKYNHENGLLKSVADFNAPSTVFWTANTVNPRGQVTQETLGNNVITNRTYDAVTGWLSSLQSGVGGGGTLQNESYLMDLVGNVIQRQNNQAGLTENFFYDNLYRLDYSQLNGVENLNLSYDATGNILTRSDVAGGALWTYHATKKHAVTQAGSAAYNYTYDDNGNVTGRHGLSVTWTSFNHPSLINGASGESVEFAYNHKHERWRAILNSSSGIETTYFIGELLEKVVSVGTSDFRHYISAGSTHVAVYSRTSSGVNTLRYIREDHQGSIAGILNANGTSFVKESFTAFGNRRSSCTWSGPPTSGQLAKMKSVTRHGYTWHTALGDMGLNDMNGRIQDAVTGRFLSPDPYIPDPMHTQSYNRYSYVMNNPLTYTDPSGFWFNDRSHEAAGVAALAGLPPGASSISGSVTVCGNCNSPWAMDFWGGLTNPGYQPYPGSGFNFSGGGGGGLEGPQQQPPATPAPDQPQQDAEEVPEITVCSGRACPGMKQQLANAIPFYGFTDCMFTISSRYACDGGDWFWAGVGIVPGIGVVRGATLGTRAVAYSVAFETIIPKVGAGTRPAHFKAANQALQSAMKADDGFAKMMDDLGIQIPDALGKSPAGWSWHHVPDQPGVMQLVPRSQHQGSFWQHLLHPDGVGGFKIWGSQY
jgi:RHS repeat-associated protein